MRGYLKAGAVAAVAGAAYSLHEPSRFRLRTLEAEIPAGAPRLTVLHVSDSHLMGPETESAGFLRRLPGLLEEEPDLVVATGDLIESDTGIDTAVEVYSALPARLGRFYVLGSHDYYQARRPGYLRYFRRGQDTSGLTKAADSQRLETGLQSGGYVSLTNAIHRLTTPAGKLALMGADDPHIDRDATHHLGRSEGDALAIGLVHAPDIVSEFVLAGVDIVFAGHTHAGQVRMPYVGALVTNSSLSPALAGGLHRVGNAWLHVSPGLGHGRFAPIRFLAQPEATLLELRPALT